MRGARFLKSTPLRLALTFALLFIASFLVAGTAAYLTMKEDLAERLDRQIFETFTALRGPYGNVKVGDLVSTIDRMARASIHHDRVYLIRAPTGPPLAGNIAKAPAAEGWMTVDASALGVADDHLRFRIYSAEIGDLWVTVGSSLETTALILDTALASFTLATLAVLGFAIAGGAFLASRAQRRIGIIAGTMDAISEGRLDARIPITRAEDDLDQLSAQINAALDRLTRLIEGMRQVSSDIAHDLKTPINRLYIAIETALEQVAEDKADTAGLNEALSAARQVNDTFDALLRISQIEAGARRSRFMDIDLVSILETVFDAYEPVAEERGHALSLAVSSKRPIAIFGDRDLLLQMLANLIDNAIRHTPPGAPIRLEGHPARGSAGGEIVVSDAGAGIPAAEREKVFQRLYRLEKSRTTPGSGLGLSLVKAIAELHGASITLSDNAPGLRVSVVFPLRSDFVTAPAL
jgi:signal transduction histidine kinase